MDVAALGLEVQSAQVVKATGELNRLSVAAAAAEANAAKLAKQKMAAGQTAAAAKAALDFARAQYQLSKSSEVVIKDEVQLAKTARDTALAHSRAAQAALYRARAEDTLAAAQARAARQALRDYQDANPQPRNPPGNDNLPRESAGANRHNVGNILAQFQDIGVTAAMGMNPFMIAVQQGTQLASVLMTMEKPLKGLMAAFIGLLGVTQLLTIGIIALVAALLQWVNWTKVAQFALETIADILPMVAQGVALLGAAIAIAFAPAILSTFLTVFLTVAAGIVSVIGTIIAAIGAIPLAIGLILADLYIFRDEWAAALGVDVVGVAKDAVNFIIGAFVGAYHDIQFLWQKFPDVIEAAAIGAANAVIRAVNAIVAATVKGINAVIGAANAIGTSWIAEQAGIGFEIKTVDPNLFQFDEQANAAAERLKKAVGDRNEQLRKDLTYDYLGAMGGAINDAAEWASGKLRNFSKGLGLDDKKKKGSGGKTEEEKYEDIVKGAERRIASLQAEKDAIGLTEEASARLRYETELLNQAQQKGITLNATQKLELASLAEQMARVEEETRKAKEALEFAKDLTKSFVADFRQGLKDGEGFWGSFANAAMNAMDKIIDKLLNDVIDALFQVNKAGSGGGTGGWLGFLGSLFGGQLGVATSGGVGLYAKGGIFDRADVHKFAKGGAFTNQIVTSPTLFKFAKGTGMMGEAGAEAIMPLSRDASGKLGVSMLGGGQGGEGKTVVVGGSFDVFVNEDGQWEARVREISANESERVTGQGIKAFSDRQLPDRMAQINKNPRRRGPV